MINLDAAGLLVRAIVATPVGGLAGALDRRQRPVEDADNVSDADLVRRLCQSVAAALALFGIDEAGVAQLAQNRIENIFFGISLVSAISVTSAVSPGTRPARWTMAFSPYLPFFRQHS